MSHLTTLYLRLFVGALFCLTGCLSMWGLIGLDRSAFSAEEVRFLYLFAGFGAFAGGAVFASMIGRTGAGGWVLAALGSLFGTLLGSGLGGMAFGILREIPQTDGHVLQSIILVLQLGVGSMMLVFVGMFLSLAGPIWLGMMVFNHVITRRLRRRFPPRIKAAVFD